MKTIALTTRRSGIQRKKMRGAFSIDLGMALLIAAVLIAGAVYAFIRHNRQVSIDSNVTAINNIIATAKGTYGGRNQYGAVTTAVAVQGHVIPAELRDGAAATASNGYGAAITVAPATTGTGGANDTLLLTWGNVPSQQCSDIVIGVEGSLRRLAVGGTDIKALDSTLNETLLTTECEKAPNVVLTMWIGRQ